MKNKISKPYNSSADKNIGKLNGLFSSALLAIRMKNYKIAAAKLEEAIKIHDDEWNAFDHFNTNDTIGVFCECHNLMSEAPEGSKTRQDATRITYAFVELGLYKHFEVEEMACIAARAQKDSFLQQSAIRKALAYLDDNEKGLRKEGILSRIAGLHILVEGVWPADHPGWRDLAERAVHHIGTLQSFDNGVLNEEQRGDCDFSYRKAKLILSFVMKKCAPTDSLYKQAVAAKQHIETNWPKLEKKSKKEFPGFQP